MAATLAQPLKGVRVIELSTMVTASLASMMLADQGAEVIKVEPNILGDPMRFIGSQKNGISALFANCNRGKRAIAVDLKSDLGQELVARLAGEADILVHNYRAGVMDRLNLGSAKLRAANPKLIYMAITGFGKEGDLSRAPAYDHVMQALTGVTGVQAGEKGPEFMRTLIADKITAYTAAQGLTAALLARSTTGEGQHIDLSMLQSTLNFLWPDGMMAQTLLAEDVAHFAPMSDMYETYETGDGHIAIAAATDAHWQSISEIIDRPDIPENPKFNSIFARSANLKELLAAVKGAFTGLSTDAALAALKQADVPAAPCLMHEDVIAHPQVAAVGALQKQTHPLLGDLLATTSAVQFEGQAHCLEGPCPAHGQHTAEVLAELGYGSDAIHAAHEAGEIVAA